MNAFRLLCARRFRRVVVSCLVLLTAGLALADDRKISPDLRAALANSNGNLNVIVQYHVQEGGGLLGGGLVGNLVGGVLNLVGGVVKAVFSLIPAVSALLSPIDIVALSNQQTVDYISLDRPVRPSLDYSTAAAGAPMAWAAGLDGSGVGIAVIDSGIYPHQDLTAAYSNQSRIVYRQSFVPGTKYDDYGHGTHVAGIAAGNGRASSGPGSFRSFRGVAPNANLIDLRVLDVNGMSSDTAVISALETAVKLKNRYNIRVINLSLGRPIFEGCNLDPLCRAVEAAWRSGIVVVTAAGNLGRNGYATILCPGNSPHAITVGAMKTMATTDRSDDRIASYSSKGPTFIDLTAKPDVVAPGNLVDSLLASGSTLSAEYPGNIVALSEYTTGYADGPVYFRLSGTSMATPVVAGAVALMLQRSPSLTPDTVKARIMKSASKSFPLYSTATEPTTGATYTSTYDLFTVGAGYLSIPSALQSNLVANSPALSPQVQLFPCWVWPFWCRI